VDYTDRGTHGGWMFSVVGEIDDMFNKKLKTGILSNASSVLGFRVMVSYGVACLSLDEHIALISFA
jgi:hypothetical protein